MNSSLSCKIDKCESSQWFLGTAGKCNTTGMCECPPGYSGWYILSAYNDCHMSDTFKDVLNSITLGCAICTLLGSLIALLKVSREITQIYKPRILPLILVGYHHKQAIVRKSELSQGYVLQRKLLVVRNTFFFLSFSVCEVYRSSLFWQSPYQYSQDLPLHIILVNGAGICSSTSGIFLFLYIYTTSLPRGGQLAAVLGIKYDERRYQARKFVSTYRFFNLKLCFFSH